MKIKLYNPSIFQGDLQKKNYFEGWYFKHVSADLKQVYSVIPGISLNADDPHAFIQVINGITGDTEYVSYPVSEFSWDSNTLYVKIGNSVFTEKYIDLDIRGEKYKVTGHIEYKNNIKFPSTLFSPGIMGWYSFVPYMECKHGVVSVNHGLTGTVTINDDSIDFSGGKGYIEKDWGTSFPECWLWIQANNFGNNTTSFTFSVAKIPWRGKFFIGFIAFLYYNHRFYIYATYNNSKLTELSHTADSIKLTLENRHTILNVTTTKQTFGVLKAPELGVMSRRIKESIDSTVSLTLTDKRSNHFYNDTSLVAGLEVIDKIFEYV